MKVSEQIATTLTTALRPTHLDVIDESYRHHVPEGAESHFKVVIISDDFIGKRLLARHRIIYQLLTEQLAGSVHALALHTYTTEEWRSQQDDVPHSPPCHGGEPSE